MISIDGTTSRRQFVLSGPQTWLAAVVLAASFLLLAVPDASAETRTLKLYYTHTRERAEITFKKNGRYIQSGLDQLNKFLRDWRRNEPTKMDPRLFDLVWEVYQSVGARDHIHVVSAYRSPATNSMLRKRSNGVAEKSQHTLGKAMDFYIPGVKLSKLRAAAFRAEGGGVGYYPKSGSPFVHLDVGNVRAWPRMSRGELLAPIPDGKTMHVPTDGKPLPGYKQALAAYQARKAKGGGTAIQLASTQRSGGGFLARLFGGGADEEEDSGEIAVASAAPEAMVGRRPAAPKPSPKVELPGVAAPEAPRQPEPQPAAAPEPEQPETIIAALPERSIPMPLFAPRPQVDVGTPVAVTAAQEALAPEASEEPAAEATELAFNVPLPMPRPAYSPTAAQPASLETDDEFAVAAVVPKRRPENGSLAIADLLAAESLAEAKTGASIPELRPDIPPQVNAYAPVTEASLTPAAQLTPLVAADPASSSKGGRVAAASPRLALLEKGPTTDASAVLGTGVRTTKKAAKPDARDLRPDPKPMVLPVREEIAHWALQAGSVTKPIRSATAPDRAHDAIREAPREVYTLGFEQGRVADANRFTGKAVSFLAVAKFSTN